VPALAAATSVDGQRATAAVGCAIETRFRIASITKPFTATLALSLVDLDATTGVWTDDVRVRHLLSHTSGFDGECGDLARLGDGDDALEAVVRELPRVRRWTGAGEVWSYANSGYWLAGWLCTHAADTTYEEALARHVFAPAGLQVTSFDEPELVGTGPDSIEGAYPRARRPSGGLVSNVDDLIRFGEWQLREPATARARVPLAKPVAGVYGLGFAGERVGGADVWGHPGSYGGFQSSLLLIPDWRAVFVGLTNSGRGSQALKEVEDAWFESLLGARRRVPEAAPLPAAALESFAGVYANEQIRAVIARDGELLRVEAEETLPTGEPGERLTVLARPIAERTFEIVGGDWAGERFDFPLRGFARIGGRLAERVS
jgi:CubicO group peptidase (beta-lactamase class C family)